MATNENQKDQAEEQKTVEESKTAQKKTAKKPSKHAIKSVQKGGIKVEFKASPTGKFGLAYNVGEKANFTKEQAAILIDAGVAKKA